VSIRNDLRRENGRRGKQQGETGMKKRKRNTIVLFVRIIVCLVNPEILTLKASEGGDDRKIMF